MAELLFAQEKKRWGNLVGIGILATILLVAVDLLIRSSSGLLDYASTMGALFSRPSLPPLFSPVWWWGFVLLVLTAGVLFPLLYGATLFRLRNGGYPALRGMWWGLMLWVLLEAIVKPAADLGFFSRYLAAPLWESLTGVILWAGYGWFFERFSRPSRPMIVEHTSQRAA